MDQNQRKALVDERIKCVHDAEAIRMKYQGKVENMTPAEGTTWDTLMDRADAIERELKMADRSAKAAEFTDGSTGGRPPLSGRKEGEAGGSKSSENSDGDAADQNKGRKSVDDTPEARCMKALGLHDTGRIDPELKSGLVASFKEDYEDAVRKYIRCYGDRDTMSQKFPAAYKALSEGIDVQGGFIVYPEFMTQLVKKLPAVTAIRANARSFPVASDIVKFPSVNYTTDDKFTSPVRITWVGENPSSTTVIDSPDSNFFGQKSIPVNTAMAALTISNDLIEDAAFDVMAYLNDNMAEAYALSEDQVFAIGTGLGQPLGIVTDATNGNISYVPSTSSGAVTADSLIDLFYGLPKQYRATAAFYMASSQAKPIRKLKDAQNRYLWDAMAVGGLTTAGDRDNLLGKPVYIDEFLPDPAANAFTVVFGDMKGYYIADRVGMSIQVLRETKAKQNQIEIVARRRVGGQTVEPFRFRVMKLSVS